MQHAEATSTTGIPIAECRDIFNQLGGYPAKLAAMAIATAHPETAFAPEDLASQLNWRQGYEPVWQQSTGGPFHVARIALPPCTTLRSISRNAQADPTPRSVYMLF